MSVGAEVTESSGSINKMVFPFVLWDYAELLLVRKCFSNLWI